MFQELSFDQLQISRPMVLTAMGYGDHTPDDYILSVVDRAIEEASRHCDARFHYRIHEGEIAGDDLRVNGILLRTGKVITRPLKGSTRFAIFTATAGARFQEWIHELDGSDDILFRFVVDSIGTELAEAAANRMQEQVDRECRENGWMHTNRYSPGYCGWHLSGQQDLFRLMDDRPCGITLTESSLMLPIKSVSGVIGIGDRVKYNEYPCAICELKDCFRRKTKATEKAQS